jgi:ribosome-binding factor A
MVVNFCLKEQGCDRCPKFTFEFDEQAQKSKNIEELFKQIAKKDEE